MIKSDIADRLERKGNLSRTKAVYLVETVLDSIKEALLKGDKVEIRGFGSFRVVPKKSGYGRDIRRNRQLTISGGIAEWDHNSVSELIETADRLLYQAKKQGRNTILRTEKS
ncbi:MAG: diguanylate cyclase [Acidobacteria bacterium]|nr:diguanylate cyclase [Acidobacteriota bacterium]